MAHFAELDENNVVIKVVCVDNNDILDENGVEQESIGIDFLENLFGHRRWKQTSYSHAFRKWYASPGAIYNEELDAFVGRQPFPSWILNSETAVWDPPVPYPDDEYVGENKRLFHWDEGNQEWHPVDGPGIV